MRRLAAASLVVLGVLGMPACSACSSTPAEIIVTDGSVLDRRSRPDTATVDEDTSIPDGAFDAGIDLFPGTWGPIPGAPPSCGAKLDLDPTNDIGDLQWTACPTGRPGCRRLVVTWTTNPGNHILFPFRQHLRIVGGIPYLSYERWFPRKGLTPDFFDAIIKIVAPIDKPAIFAVGDYISDPLDCFFNPLASEVGVEAQGLANVASDEPLALVSSFSGKVLAMRSHTAKDLGSFGGAVQSFAALGPSMFLDMSNPFSMTVYDPLADTIHVVPGQPSIAYPVAVPDGSVAVRGSGTNGLVLVHTDGSLTDLYAPTKGVFAYDVYADQSNSDQLVWLEGDNSTTSLMTAPYATTTLTAKHVTGIKSLYNGGEGLFANVGMALVVTSRTTAELIRLSDGWGWTITAEPGDGWMKPIWIDANEVWIANSNTQYKGDYGFGIVRLRRSDLGAPDIAPN